MNLFAFSLGEPWIQIFLTLAVGGFFSILLALRLYAHMSCGVCKNKIKMNGKTVLITGANSGIGKETAKDLANRGARIIMGCRNIDTANAVKDEIIKETSNDNIVVKKLDLSSQKSVRAFAEEINATEKKLDVLIHNAGIALSFRGSKSEDGIELTMATNHYGPFLLTHLLIDLMKRSAPSRIIIVASELYRIASVNLNNLNPTGTFPAAYLYYVSKYANIYFARELAQRLKDSKVSVNFLHPGMIDSGIWRNIPFPLNYPVKAITKGFFKTPKQGAQTSIFLATAEELENVTGKYFMDCKEHSISNAAMDLEKAKKLWEESSKIVNLTENDPKI